MQRSIATVVALVMVAVPGCGDDFGDGDEHDHDHDHDHDMGESSGGPGPQTSSSSGATAEGSTTSTGAADSSGGTSGTIGGTDTGGTDSGTTGEEDVAVTIAFAAAVNGEPFACGTTYGDVGTPPTQVEPRDLRFFVQDLQLVRVSDGGLVPVVLDVEEPWQAETVALVDFEDGTGACADGGGNPDTRTVVTGTVPADEYDGVRFTVGVPEDLNHGDPLFLPPPLGATSMTWGWLFGFKFMKAELQQVVEEGGVGGGTFHLGSNDCSGNPAQDDVTCALSNRAEVELASFDWTSQSIVIDVGALFTDTNMTLDTQCHSFQPDTCPPVFDRVGVDFDTGLPAPTQVAFDVQ